MKTVGHILFIGSAELSDEIKVLLPERDLAYLAKERLDDKVYGHSF
jgi:hypothetical protein